jgi:prepilin-type N-terminal cleavage/methylation domain-containing protein/prepilin-type processing-associated H-X9-DG protein
MMKLQRKNDAFTLIELLIVIAVISIVAAILFPIFAQPREKAKQVSCLSNHKQLVLSVLMYAQDYDENFPMAANMSAPNKTLWTETTLPYVRNKEVFRCRKANHNTFLSRSSLATFYADSWDNRNRASIGMSSQFLFDKTGKYGFRNIVSIEKLENPGMTVILADTPNALPRRQQSTYEGGYMFDPCSVQSVNGLPPIAATDSPHPDIANVAPYAIIGRHSGMSPISFADGHVKPLRVSIPNFEAKWQFRGCDFDKDIKQAK